MKRFGLLLAILALSPSNLRASGAQRPVVPLERMTFGWHGLPFGGLKLDGQKLPYLGGGSFGQVYAVPGVPDAVIKVIMGSPYGQPLPQVADFDARSAEAFAAAGAGPRLWQRGEVSGKPVLIKERVYGEDWGEAVSGGRFDETAFWQAMDTLGRLAEANIWANDLRPDNIFLGRTLADPTPRFLAVDPGIPLDPGPPAPTPEMRLQRVLDREFVVSHGVIAYTAVVNYGTMRRLLADALRESRERPEPLGEKLARWRLRLFGPRP